MGLSNLLVRVWRTFPKALTKTLTRLYVIRHFYINEEEGLNRVIKATEADVRKMRQYPDALSAFSFSPSA